MSKQQQQTGQAEQAGQAGRQKQPAHREKQGYCAQYARQERSQLHARQERSQLHARQERSQLHARHTHHVQQELQKQPEMQTQPKSPVSSSSPSVARGTALMSAATLLSRITGLVRTWAMAFALGNSMITSAYQVANNMPNVIFDLVAGGLLGAAFIPIYLLEKENKKSTTAGVGASATASATASASTSTNANAATSTSASATASASTSTSASATAAAATSVNANTFACNVLNLTLIVLGALTLLSSVFAPALIATQTFTVGASDDVVTLSVLFFRIFAFQIVFYGASGIITAILNANRIYFLPAVAPALNNLCVIVSFFVYVPLSAIDQQLAIIVLGIGTTLGVALQALMQIPALRRAGFRWRAFVDLHDPALIEALKIALPTMIYIIGTLVAFSCRNAVSLAVGENGPSTLLYAWTWYQLPYGVVSVSLSRALFTEMGEAAAKRDNATLRSLVERGIAGNLLLIIPLAGIMGVLSTPLMELFQAGAFGAQDVSSVAAALSAWLVSLPFYAVLMFLYNVFAALRRFMRFALVSTVLVVVQCAGYFALCRVDALGLLGVPTADFIYYAGSCVILLAVLHSMIGSFKLAAILWSTLRVLIATALGAGVAALISAYLPVEAGMLGGFIRLLVAGGAGVLISFGLCAVFRVPQMSAVTNFCKRRSGGSKGGGGGRNGNSAKNNKSER